MKLASILPPQAASLLAHLVPGHRALQPLPLGIAPPLGTPGDDDILGTANSELIMAGAGNDYVDGNGGFDHIEGEAGDDTLVGSGGLYGGDGNDQMSTIYLSSGTLASGGMGDDIYYTDQINRVGSQPGDISILEASGAGTDTIISFGGDVNLNFLQGIENITILGVRAALAVGNESDNVITGNNSRNLINGGIGADRMVGRGGNDSYVVDNLGDIIVESSGQGHDKVNILISYTLASGVEDLYCAGSNSINGAGNELANLMSGNSRSNLLTGNGGADTLNGFSDIDTLMGGTGDDLYIQSVTNAAGVLTFDTITEVTGGGTDTVQVSADLGRYTYQLDTAVENMEVTGASIFRLWGNAVNNRMTGNDAANVFDGFAGRDTLTGRGGADSFYFSALSAASRDSITDFAHGLDDIHVSAAAFGGGLVAGGSVSLVSGTTPLPTLAHAQFLYNSGTGTLSFDADGTGAGAAVQFAVLTNLPALTANDFVIYA